MAPRSEKRAAVAASARPDPCGRTRSDLGRLADGLMKMLESDRARASAMLGDEIVPVLTIARYLIEDAARKVARGEAEGTSEALRGAAALIRDATRQLLGLC